MFKPISPVALNNSTFVPIPVDKNTGDATFVLQADDSIDVYLSDTSAGTNIFTLKSEHALAVSINPNVQEGSFILCYAKSASSTPHLQVLQIK